MSAKVFLDTNVLIYAAAGDEVASRRNFATRPRNRRERKPSAISTQVIGEFVDNVQKPEKDAVVRSRLTRSAEWVEWLFAFPADVEVDREIVVNAA